MSNSFLFLNKDSDIKDSNILDKLIRCLEARENYKPRCVSAFRPKNNGSLKFGWWNVGLMQDDNVNNEQYKKMIVSKVLELIQDIDVFGLGEFLCQDVFDAIKKLMPRNYCIEQLYENPEQRVSFDTVVIYNKGNLVKDENVDKEKCNLFLGDGVVIPGQYRIAQKVIMWQSLG